MNGNKTFKLVFIILIGFIVSGCSNEVLDTKSLLKPPKISNKYEEIQLSLNKIIDEYTLVTPPEGLNKEVIYLFNLFGDEKEESVIILKDNIVNQMKIIILKQNDNNEWVLEKSFSGSGYGVKRIDFKDLDGDGLNEIIVGWKGATAINNGISVYSMVNNKFSEVFNENYTTYGIADVDNDFNDELLVIKLDRSKGKANATLYDLDINSKLMYYVDQVKMDGYVNNYYSINCGNVSKDRKGFLVDVSIGAHSSYTDLIIFRNGRLKNVFYNDKWEYTDLTFRPYASKSMDIDNDGILEIPLLRVPKGYENASFAETPFITVWMKWNGLDGLKYDVETFSDYKNNFTLTFPEEWRNNATLEVEDNKYIFKYYSISEKKMYDVFELQVVDKKDYYDNKNKYIDYNILETKINKEYLVKINEDINEEKATINFEFIKENFKLGR